MGEWSAGVFNSALGATAIATAGELGLLDELEQRGEVDVSDFCERHALQPAPWLSVARLLEGFGVVELCPKREVMRPGTRFAETYRTKGYFLWLVRGYGGFWQNLPRMLRNDAGEIGPAGRDAECIAAASMDYGARFVDPHFRSVLGEVPCRFAADLGCGAAGRLLELAQKDPDFRGVGLDIRQGVVELARRSARAAGLADRVSVLEADVAKLELRPEFQNVDVLFSFFMGHYLWPRANCLAVMRNLRVVFPRAKRFLFCDTHRSELPSSGSAPIFTLGFELSHAVMNQYIPTAEEWMSLFAEAGWTCARRHDIDLPFSSIFDLRREPPEEPA